GGRPLRIQADGWLIDGEKWRRGEQRARKSDEPPFGCAQAPGPPLQERVARVAQSREPDLELPQGIRPRPSPAERTVEDFIRHAIGEHLAVGELAGIGGADPGWTLAIDLGATLDPGDRREEHALTRPVGAADGRRLFPGQLDRERPIDPNRRA